MIIDIVLTYLTHCLAVSAALTLVVVTGVVALTMVLMTMALASLTQSRTLFAPSMMPSVVATNTVRGMPAATDSLTQLCCCTLTYCLVVLGHGSYTHRDHSLLRE